MHRMQSLLDQMQRPADLRALSREDLDRLAGDVRQRIIDTVSRTGGHLAANLGVVEMTIAILRVFDAPRDKVIWDTSHQTYAWKLLTDRRDRFHTLRQPGGISGFLNRDESPYDAFGAGHAGTALSAALGMAVARDRLGGNEHVIAVLGDASAGCGISLEALNNLAGTTRRLIVILNDNKMSIASNVGSISNYLGRLLSNPRYNRWKRSVETLAERLRMGGLRRFYYRMEEAIKSLFLRSALFEEFGLRYIGPVDGHDFTKLLGALSIARDSDRPIIVHMSTRKGKGYGFAEAHPEKWHGAPCFDVPTGEMVNVQSKPSYSKVFGDVLKRLGAEDPRICAITAGMCSGTGMDAFAKAYPERFFDVGISEEHAAVFAAGLAARGLRPVYAVYSTFSQRAVDCIIHDICLQRLPVLICLDRAGIVGDDGPTHHGVFDIPLLRPTPNLTIMQPADEAELAAMVVTALRSDAPCVIRYPRGAGTGADVPERPEPILLGKAVVVRAGKRAAIWALGDMLPAALAAAEHLAGEGIDAAVVNPRFVRPLDTALLDAQAAEAAAIVTIENGMVSGGFGSAVAEHLCHRGYAGRVTLLGWPDSFVPQGAPELLLHRHGLTAGHIVTAVKTALLGHHPAK
jgi:1-deoxy-D-xylulose-5-phosphate synthase